MITGAILIGSDEVHTRPTHLGINPAAGEAIDQLQLGGRA
jgi:hypothetical protein